ncbi:maleylpyruvate isomerase N-terminal domain-containing protein [Spirilliplanes yamanashiensis]|uniref:Mycothiol-dependent maleylpyruvate isomerase metal-binding domain-containing protein n=1 Tax=Spirilliplanes yamanashiensis TaxID=42233 RepID=A0A8J3Y973_9ACTN|nr:maleylpyruvate isomerase N-terminal domain-containing protein [Spirilliplanes yamanashiensis]MDP9815575.1 uncharacterized protein (TIGR03083 family) [Spirilliplanes yamanashiensis]GIJ03829.1 hypothetical protein Sya03_31810 [Spirilliplanes yamanashiensis]
MSYLEIRSAATGQFALLAERVGQLTDADLALPTRLPPWTVRELVAHVTRNIDALAGALAAPAPEAATVTLDDYYGLAAAAADGIRERAAGEAATGIRWQDEIGAVAARVTAALPGADRLVTARMGDLTLEDFLVTRCVEGTVHGFDLARALDAPPGDWLHPAATDVCLRLLARLGAAHGITADVRTAPVVVGYAGRAVTTTVAGYAEWATGRGPAPAPWLDGLPAVIR